MGTHLKPYCKNHHPETEENPDPDVWVINNAFYNEYISQSLKCKSYLLHTLDLEIIFCEMY